MNRASVRGLWRGAELPVGLRINQHKHEKENIRVMLDWYYRAARLFEASPLCRSPSAAPPFLLLLSSYFLLETPDGLVHLFPLLFTECSGRKMKFMVIGLCQAGQCALFPSGCPALALPLSIHLHLSLSLHFHLILSVCSIPFLFHSVSIIHNFTTSEISFNIHGLLRLTGVSETQRV